MEQNARNEYMEMLIKLRRDVEECRALYAQAPGDPGDTSAPVTVPSGLLCSIIAIASGALLEEEQKYGMPYYGKVPLTSVVLEVGHE